MTELTDALSSLSDGYLHRAVMAFHRGADEASDAALSRMWLSLGALAASELEQRGYVRRNPAGAADIGRLRLQDEDPGL